MNRTLDELDTPCVVIDAARVEANLQRAQAHAGANGYALRPHIKTHKLPRLALRQVALGAVGITVQKLGEAEVMADAGAPLHELVADLLEKYGPAHYRRVDMKLARPVTKAEMVRGLSEGAPSQIDGVSVEDVQTADGVKYYLDDGSWLLIRPSGTEPVLRVYAEAPDAARVSALLAFGEEVAQKA